MIKTLLRAIFASFFSLFLFAILNSDTGVSELKYKSVEEIHLLRMEIKKKENDKLSEKKKIDKHLKCLAENIYHEARGESYYGQVAVAQITLNRANHPLFPNDICDVVYQKNKFNNIVVCQFSWACMKQARKRLSEKELKSSYDVAYRVLIEGERIPSLNKAIFYHADYINPNWPHKKVSKIGKHIFYNRI